MFVDYVKLLILRILPILSNSLWSCNSFSSRRFINQYHDTDG